MPTKISARNVQQSFEENKTKPIKMTTRELPMNNVLKAHNFSTFYRSREQTLNIFDVLRRTLCADGDNPEQCLHHKGHI